MGKDSITKRLQRRQVDNETESGKCLKDEILLLTDCSRFFSACLMIQSGVRLIVISFPISI